MLRINQRIAGLAVLCGALGVWSGPALAETLRVTSWDMHSPGSGAARQLSAESLATAAATLRQINPDVILLQGVDGWQTCDTLAKLLKPAEFHVVLCSSFSGLSSRGTSAREVSILAKRKAYSFWSEPWKAQAGEAAIPGGFAFAAFEFSKWRLGVYCVETRKDSLAASAQEQLSEHLKRVKAWEVNAVQIAAIGGSFAASTEQGQLPQLVALLQESGFADTCFELAPERKLSGASSGLRSGSATTFMLAERSAFGVNPQEISAAGQLYVTCDLELDPAKVAAGWPARAQELERRTAILAKTSDAQRVSHKPGAKETNAEGTWWIAIAAGAFGALLLIVLLVSRNRRRLALPRPSATMMLPPPENSLSGLTSCNIIVSAPSQEREASIDFKPGSVVISEPVASRSTRNLQHVTSDLKLNEAERTSLLKDLGRWLKVKLVRRLVKDREQLLEAHETAAFRAKAVEERLSKVEQQIQQQTRVYEERIEGLTLELLAAKEENRELIRARIAQVKLEMAAVRAKVMAQSEAAAD